MSADPVKPSKAERQADVALVVGYHEARLEEMQGRGETIDWWERGNPERRRH